MEKQMKLLIHENKYVSLYFDVSTPEKEKDAFVALFNYMDNVCNYYEHCVDVAQIKAIREARKGNFKMIMWLLRNRIDYEYEKWHTDVCVSSEEMEDWKEYKPPF